MIVMANVKENSKRMLGINLRWSFWVKIIALIIPIFLVTTIITKGFNDDSKHNLKLQMENDNFKFYSYDIDKECINDLAKVLDENYIRILNDLEAKLSGKVEIEIYPDIKSYHNAIGMPNEPNWAVGRAYGNKIQMVSPLKPGDVHTYDSLMQTVVHEFTHIVVSNINPNITSIPVWLNEGIATYEAKQTPYFNGNNIPPLSLSQISPTKFAEAGGYQFSYTIIEYIVKNYGYATIISLIKTPSDSEKILGMSMTEFENKCKSYLKKAYIPAKYYTK